MSHSEAARGFAVVQFLANATNDPNGLSVGRIQGAIDLALATESRFVRLWDTNRGNRSLDPTLVDLASSL
jgi:hypothetical protein